MNKPRYIILIRHGESESNKDLQKLLSIPFHKIGLTNTGKEQSYWIGCKLLKFLTDTLYPSNKFDIAFHVSPYLSTRETLKCILKIIDKYNDLATIFQDEDSLMTKRSTTQIIFDPCKKRKWATWPPRDYIQQDTFVNYHIREDPRLREQDIGNSTDLNHIEDLMNVRLNYGKFFYRFPQGENASDVLDRVASFQTSLFRTFNKPSMIKDNRESICVLISHEIFIKAFLMRWFNWTVEEFEQLDPIENGDLIIMELDQAGNRYTLKTEMKKTPFININT